MSPRYKRMMEELENGGTTSAKCFGTSMLPRIQSGSVLTFMRCDDYETGDIVFCKVSGNYIDAHLIKSKDTRRGWLIANNRGHLNGWTHTIYGKVTKAVFPDKSEHVI